ncbi:nucleoside recognition domain-containing protein [Porphyromonas sp. COT-290 OH3588]|uniref:nucleoside recognition domain-containing protein n=1 Tax=Porphyromonas sp. COT-290 OH3588 TaxID=1515617 RepID=UPI00052B5658|nr:spore maturation protein [Porphyromonas sp. COT-290 OH3588]KGO01754.1 membrane protein [Porphyromonas sp. COT-290 OH3588]
MVLNYIFVGFFVIAFVMALGHLFLTGDFLIFERIMKACFDQSKNGFEISLYLTGVLCLWLGLLKIAERTGIIQTLASWASPLLSILFPSVPKNHPAMGNIFMNISANMLGLDNAATPLGLKTMESLQSLNPRKEEPTDAMLMFLGLNASGLTIIPSSVIAFRMQAGAVNPADVFLPILMATTASTLVVMLLMAIKQRINLWRRPMIMFLLVVLSLFASIVWLGAQLPPEEFSRISTGISSMVLVGIILAFVFGGVRRRINVYESFIEGAKEGFSTAVGIIPYLIAMLVGIGVFRASGAMDLFAEGLLSLFESLGWDSRWVEALPTMLMKPLSGSGARGLMVDAMQTHGADSFVGRLACTVQGASDTTFYIIALYFGAIGIRRTAYAVPYSLLADLAGAVTATLVTYLFFA